MLVCGARNAAREAFGVARVNRHVGAADAAASDLLRLWMTPCPHARCSVYWRRCVAIHGLLFMRRYACAAMHTLSFMHRSSQREISQHAQ